jgi:argininosuccinate lyase
MGTLKIIPELIQSIEVDTNRSHDLIDKDMLMTSKVNTLVQTGMPFREAYLKIKAGKDISTSASLKNKQINKFSSGSPFNLQLSLLRRRLKKHID